MKINYKIEFAVIDISKRQGFGTKLFYILPVLGFSDSIIPFHEDFDHETAKSFCIFIAWLFIMGTICITWKEKRPPVSR